MLFHFSQYSALLLIGFLQGMVFAFMLWRRGHREDRYSDYFLALLLVLCCAHIAQYMLGFGGWYDSRDWHSTFMFYFPFHNFLLMGPVIYFYFRSLTNEDFRLEPKHSWHFYPGLFFYFVALFVFVFDFFILKHWLDIPFFLHSNTKGLLGHFLHDRYLDLLMYPGYLSTFIYLAVTLREYRPYRKYIDNYYSDTDQISFNWLRNLLIIVIAGFAVNWLFAILSNFYYLGYTGYWISHFATSIMIYALAILGYTSTHKLPQKLHFSPEAAKEEDQEKLVSKEEELVLERWKKKLEKLMETEKPYLHPNLSLGELAQLLSTNTSVLSKVINSGYEQNFNEFVNAHRVREVESKLTDPDHKHLTIMGIALDCGFNSKATFNRAFRKFTGMSPREYTARTPAK